jgi:hypothetical protein
MTLVQHLPERDLGVAADVDVLRTIADELKKTTTHIDCMILTGKKYLSAKATRPVATRTYLPSKYIPRRDRFYVTQVFLTLKEVVGIRVRRQVAASVFRKHTSRLCEFGVFASCFEHYLLDRL